MTLKILIKKCKKNFIDFLDDSTYRKLMYIKVIHKFPNFKTPKTFNEKINHRILFNRKDIYTYLADKIKVKEYVKNKVGSEFLIKTIDVFENAEDIKESQLPEKFVLKCNHDAESVIICKDKKKFDFECARKFLNKKISEDMYSKTREWQYKNIARKIICEEFIDIFRDENTPEDYKVHCFHGEPKFIEVHFSRFSNANDNDNDNDNRRVNYYDLDWNIMPFTVFCKNTDSEIEKPKELNDLICLASNLSKEIDYCRVDFYLVDGYIYFGEITLTPCNGMYKFIPGKWDLIFGQLW